MTTFIHDLIAQSAKKAPDSNALSFKSDTLSYSQLQTQIEHVANGYLNLDINRFDRIGVYLQKTFETVTSLFASSVVGGVFVPINPVLKAQQVQHIVNDCDIKIIVTNKGRLSSLRNILPSMPSVKHIIVVDAKEEDITVIDDVNIMPWSAFIAAPKIEKDIRPHTSADIAAILYTSGSTGKPKGVVLSHANVVEGAKSVATYLENTADDVILAVLPLSFDYGLSQLTTSFLVGASCVLLDYLLPNDVLKTIDKYQVTGLAAVPPLWSQLCSLKWHENVGKSVRYFTNSGGALTTTNLNTLRSLMPQAKPFLMYGLTEAFRSTYLPPEEIDNRPQSMGKAIPNAEVIVVRKDGTECDPHEAGELVHKGPLVSLGYWNAPEKTAERFKPSTGRPDGIITQELAVWSGDTVKKDEDGFLYFVARADEMIKTSGYRVSPMEIEEILYQHNFVAEAAIVGVPHPQLGQAIVAVTCSNSSEELITIEKALNKHCQKELANYMVPKKIIVLSELPHNANGKIDRATLHKTYQNYFTE